MSTTHFNPESPPPDIIEPEGGVCVLPDCPVIPQRPPLTKRQILIPLVLVVVVGGVIAMMFTQGGIHSGGGMGFVFMPIMMIGMLLMWSTGRMSGGGNRNIPTGAQVTEIRRTFAVELDNTRRKVHDDGRLQFDFLTRLHPDPDQLIGLVGSSQMWERSGSDPHFGEIRIGTHTAKLEKQIMPAGDVNLKSLFVSLNTEGVPADSDPFALDALIRFGWAQSTINGAPISLSLLSTPMLRLTGEQQWVYELVYSMICQAAKAHSPLDLKIMVVTDQPDLWDWIKWLPHASDDTLVHPDSGGPGRLMWSSASEMLTKIHRGSWLTVRNEVRDTTRPPYNRDGPFTRPHWLVFNDTDVSQDSDWDWITAGRQGVNNCTFITLVTEQEEAEDA